MRRLSDGDRSRIEDVIARNAGSFAGIRGFLGAEPGFPLIEGRLAREPAIIVFVDRKLPETSLLEDQRAPREIEGVRVDVVQADPWKQVELGPTPGVEREADFGGGAAAPIGYRGIEGDPIDQTYETAGSILCHVGPDSGWTTLRDFLEQTQESLEVALYDFSADYLAKTLIDTATANDVAIELTIDDGLRDDEQEIQERLATRLGERYSPATVYCGGGRRFRSAYHPKVAVQDGRRFWLSSGNWSPRSQPPIDPLAGPDAARGMYGRGNREWHIVVDDEPLAELFTRYILHDKAQAEADGPPGDRGVGAAPEGFPDLFVSVDDLIAEAQHAVAAVVEPVAPQNLPSSPRTIPVRPLLSPDNYASRISEWMRAAERSLYLQYSYINYSRAPHDQRFRDLLDHLGELSWRDDFDLRIIVGSNSVDKVRLLAENGFNERVLRVQAGVHNKGAVADGKEVLVSSQNWSGDGFLRNRDAGLIIADEEIAGYFQRIFLSDWSERTRDPFAAPSIAATIAPPGVAPPAGMVRMSWADYFGE